VLRSIIKQAALKAFPDAALTFFSMRSRRFRERQCHERGLDRLAPQVAEATTGKVTSGPFAGMILIECIYVRCHSDKSSELA
jgi:hypothetical protein